LQHPAFADFAKELPNVNIKRAARLRKPIVSFFISILLKEICNRSQMTLVTQKARLTRKRFAMGGF
jgi:hypothetical protein